MLALDAPPLDELSIAGASAAAPILDCPDPDPTDAAPTDAVPSDGGGAGPTITLPPTDLGADSPVADAGSALAVALLVLAASAGGAVAIARRRVRG